MKNNEFPKLSDKKYKIISGQIKTKNGKIYILNDLGKRKNTMGEKEVMKEEALEVEEADFDDLTEGLDSTLE